MADAVNIPDPAPATPSFVGLAEFLGATAEPSAAPEEERVFVFSDPAAPKAAAPAAVAKPAATPLLARMKHSFAVLARNPKALLIVAVIAVATAGTFFVSSRYLGDEIYLGNASLALRTSSTSVGVGDVFPVTLHLDSGGEGFLGFGAIVLYDPSAVELVSEGSSGPYQGPTSTYFPNLVFTPGEEGGKGKLGIIGSRTDENNPPGNVDLLTLKFRALKEGDAVIDLKFTQGTSQESSYVVRTAKDGDPENDGAVVTLAKVEGLKMKIGAGSDDGLITGGAGAGEVKLALKASPARASDGKTVTFTATITPTKASTLTMKSALAEKDLGSGSSTLSFEDDVTVEGIPDADVGGDLKEGLILTQVPAGTRVVVTYRAEAEVGGAKKSVKETVTVIDAANETKTATASVSLEPAAPTPAVPVPTVPSFVPPVTVIPTSLPSGAPAPTPSIIPLPNPVPAPSIIPPVPGTTPAPTTPTGTGSVPAPTPPPATGSVPVTPGSTGSIPSGGAPASSDLPFPDVPPSHPAYRAILALHRGGAITGYENGRFGPDAAITRAEVAKIVVLAVKAPTVLTGPSFSDLDASARPQDAEVYATFLPGIHTALKNGWITPVTETTFGPWFGATKDVASKAIVGATGKGQAVADAGVMTRADFCIALAQALGL